MFFKTGRWHLLLNMISILHIGLIYYTIILNLFKFKRLSRQIGWNFFKAKWRLQWVWWMYSISLLNTLKLVLLLVLKLWKLIDITVLLMILFVLRIIWKVILHWLTVFNSRSSCWQLLDYRQWTLLLLLLSRLRFSH